MNYFELFHLAPSFVLDANQLAVQYRQLQQQYHPDRYAAASDGERLQALQQASDVNAAYQTLKDPLSRAEYLLTLQGLDIRDEQQTLQDPEFLMQQLDWREELEALREAGGDAAVTAFAERRVAEILSGVTPVSEGADREDVVRAVVEAFRRHGYAATVNETAGNIQICHHHCPISHVAHDFPQLCAAEHDALSNLLGQHIQPLATIADGNGICTTNIPIRPITPTSAPAERSGQ